MTKARENSDYTGLQGDLALKSTVASPVFTGNVGIGVTPETWGTNGDFTGLQVGTGLSLYGRGAGDEDRVGMMGNAYHDATNDRYEYIGTGHATHYAHSDGQHVFQVAPSGTADAAISFTTAMAIDNAGRVTKPLQPSFMARGYASRPSGVVLFSSVPHNVGSHYNNSNGRFTAPIAGNYLMTWFANAKSATNYMNWTLHINGNEYGGAFSDAATANYDTTGGAMVVSLAAGDYVIVFSATNYAAPATTTSYSFFSGYLLG